MSVNLTVIGGSQASAVDIGSFTSDQKHPLGTMAIGKDGSIYEYCQAGAADLVVGTLLQRAAPVANHLANTPPAVAIGANSFSYTPGATAGAANLYAEGYLQVDTTPGNGYRYGVSGHPAIVSATAFTLTLDEPIRDTALTASSRVGLHHHRAKNVIIAPTTLTAPAVGVAVAPITAVYFGWMLVVGEWPGLINGTPAVGVGVTNSATTAGALDVVTTTNLVTSRQVGYMSQVGVSTKNNMVMFNLL